MAEVPEEAWTTIESDPGVFTELLQEMGVKAIQVEELYSLDEETLDDLGTCYGLIFLFKWKAEKDDRVPDPDAGEKVFFARQIITNACATQALLSVLLNAAEIEIGPELARLKEFTAGFTPEMKGLAIGNSEMIRQAHNSFAPPQPFISDESRKADKDDDLYHFVAYVPVQDDLYELDGLRSGPIRLEPDPDEAEDSKGDLNWLYRVAPHIEKRIQRYNQEEIRFNLMAIVKDRRTLYYDLLMQLEGIRSGFEQTLESKRQNPVPSPELEDLENQLAELTEERARLEASFQAEEEKHQRWRDENIRRKHNYIPFLFNFLKVLAERGKLAPLIEAAKAKPQASASAGPN